MCRLQVGSPSQSPPQKLESRCLGGATGPGAVQYCRRTGYQASQNIGRCTSPNNRSSSGSPNIDRHGFIVRRGMDRRTPRDGEKQPLATPTYFTIFLLPIYASDMARGVVIDGCIV